MLCTSKNDTTLVSGAKKITDIVIDELNNCIEKLEIKRNICRARSTGDTLKRLSDNITEVDYMCALNDFVNFLHAGAKRF